MMMLPEVEDNKQDQYYMLINRSKLLVDSFEYIAKLANMPGSFFVEFKEEQAIRPGVLRAWFLLASQEIFNPNNTLLVACPDDNRSFFPNQVVGVEYQGQITIQKPYPRSGVRVDSHMISGSDPSFNVGFRIGCRGRIVKSMFVELRKMLLFFWTSIKSLTLEGFVGLDSRLSIHKTSEFDDHLPSSHT
uniref:HECT-type E3 ubiquitin transferase n=1 Tax=Solanum tuberosum TaxID=4113 RepID=M1DWG8_SOLTU